MRKRFTVLVAIALATLTAVSGAPTLAAAQRGPAPAPTQNRRPNILLVIMDDIGMPDTAPQYSANGISRVCPEGPWIIRA